MNNLDQENTGEHAASEARVYYYESAGIAERQGEVPLWLWLVVISLLLWGLYYLVTYWSAPGLMA